MQNFEVGDRVSYNGVPSVVQERTMNAPWALRTRGDAPFYKLEAVNTYVSGELLERIFDKVYIAASYPRKAEAAEYARQYAGKGYTVVSKWHDLEEGYDKGEESLVVAAKRDLKNLMSCDVFVCLTGDKLSSGGRHTELGVAIALKKVIYIIGPRESVFHRLECINVV